jgi:release factor-specific protein-(glutamine-N5) methyltransferase
VLIPRQDTELLVEKCIELVNDIKLSGNKLLIGVRTHDEEAVKKTSVETEEAAEVVEASDTVEKGLMPQRTLADKVALQKQSSIKVLDVCTGSGCIAVSIAHYCPESVITACDISQDALDIARTNSELNGTWSRVEFRHGDLFAALDTEQRFDIIASNPPYIKTATIAELQREVKDHEPQLALDGGDDGLEFYRKIVSQAPDYLNEHGWLVLEIGYNQGKDVSKLMERSFCDIKILRDFGGNDRVVAGQLI